MANKNTNRQKMTKPAAYPAQPEINGLSDKEFEEYIKAQTNGEMPGGSAGAESADNAKSDEQPGRGSDSRSSDSRSRRGYEDGRREILERWFRDTERLKKEVPDFDLDTAMQNPEFRDLVISGMSIDGAYYAVKYKELNGSSRRPIMQNASSRAVKPGSSVNDMMSMNDRDFRKKIKNIIEN